eukprot:m.6884 g.6884  ORF g.6884 m.6884 type:complete len:220 (+) comp6347_c0_seq1:163-822(+)
MNMTASLKVVVVVAAMSTAVAAVVLPLIPESNPLNAPAGCCAGNVSGAVYGPMTVRLLPPVFENVLGYTWTRGKDSVFFANTTLGPAGWLYLEELKTDFLWADGKCVKLPDSQSTDAYCAGEGQFWDTYKGTARLGTKVQTHWYSASSTKNVFQMWFDTESCLPVFQMGGFGNETSWVYQDLSTTAVPPPGVFEPPAVCKEAEEITREQLQGYPLFKWR